MGLISIAVPGDVQLDCQIDNIETVEKILKIVKKSGKKKKAKKEDTNIVGIWKDRFDDNESSGSIQKQWREKNWERF
jgi:hypothetical protein